MKRGGRGPARLGLHIHEHQIGGGAIPIGEMRKVQGRLRAAASPIHGKQRQGEEDAGAGVHFQGHGAEPSPAGCIAAHRPREVGRIGGGERRINEPGRLPVGRQRNRHLFEHGTRAQQFATHLHRFLFQVVDRDPGGDSSLPAAHREDGVSDGWAGLHHGLADAGVVKAHASRRWDER